MKPHRDVDETEIDFAMLLQHLEGELVRVEERRLALKATIAALQSLLKLEAA